MNCEQNASVGRRAVPEGVLAQREVAEDPRIAQAHKLARRVLGSPEYKVSESEFIKRFTKKVVDEDTAFAKSKRLEFEARDTPQQKEAHVLAEIFEAILVKEGKESGWLGEDVKILKTADYDDIVNRTDLIAEWHGLEAHSLGLAVDVTFGPSTLERKFQHIQEDIDKGRLGKLKYAHSEQTGVPRVVIGMSRETVKELMDLWLEEDFTALGEHPIQRVLLEQICSQLMAISQYARTRGNGHIADVYERSLTPLRRILASKSQIPLDAMQNDAVSAGIKSQLDKRFSVRKH